MKTLGMILGLLSFCTLPVLTGCTSLYSSDADMEYIFTSTGSDVLVPIDYLWPNQKMSDDDILNLNQALEAVRDNHGCPRADYALIVNENDLSLVSNNPEMGGKSNPLCSVDASLYSIVISKKSFPDTRYYVSDQRILSDKGTNKLYLRCKVALCGQTIPTSQLFVAIYPKLASSDIRLYLLEDKMYED
ncbi:MAG: hypothetical protein IJU27_04185 [Bacteroidales bacterium]|nr:hypothetical protein [Bacteroidales bacterium]